MSGPKTNKESAMAIKRGDRILTENPFVYALQSRSRLRRCDYCLTSGQVMKCSNCQYVSYCDSSCQKRAWRWHKFECSCLKRIQPRVVPDAARMLCRIIIKLANGGDLERGYYTPDCSRKFRDLMSHYTEIKNDVKRLEHLEALHAILNEMMQDNIVVPNKSELMSIYGRFVTNSFNILDEQMNTIGTAIYLGVSVVDHSCKPNAVVTFEGKTLHVHAIEDIENLDWSKIFITYIDLLDTAEVRREQLLNSYYFLCICENCTDLELRNEMLAAACPNPNCNTAINITDTNCAHCETAVSSEHRHAYNETMEFTKMHMEQMKDMAYLDICRMCLKKQRGVLHKLNLWHVKTLDAALEAAIAVEKWSDALDYGHQLLPGFRKYYGDWNPLLGLLYIKLAKIQTFERYPKEAQHNINEGKKILLATYGSDHSLLREL